MAEWRVPLRPGAHPNPAFFSLVGTGSSQLPQACVSPGQCTQGGLTHSSTGVPLWPARTSKLVCRGSALELLMLCAVSS